jgi:hypothetical protein
VRFLEKEPIAMPAADTSTQPVSARGLRLSPDKEQISLVLNRDILRRMRIEAARRGVPRSALLALAISDWLDRNEGGSREGN